MKTSRTGVFAGVLVLVVALLTLVPSTASHAVQVPETLSHRSPVGAGPVEPGFAVDHLGVLWNKAPGGGHGDEHAANGAVRFRHQGFWGDWIPLIKADAAGRGLWASGLVSGDGADAFQVRGVPAGAGSPRAVAMNTSDGPLRTTGRKVFGADAVDNCVSRAEWGADEDLRDLYPGEGPLLFHPTQVLTIHHTATTNNDSDPAGTVRAILQWHTVDNGWRDIGYQYLIDEQGKVYEGRYSDSDSQSCSQGGTGADFGHESTVDDALMVQGAHAGGWNSGNLGIGMIGSFNERGRYSGTPTTSAKAALEGLLAELSERHGIDPTSTLEYVSPIYDVGNDLHSKVVDAISGHRDYNSTECPGGRLYASLPEIRSNVAALIAAGEGGPVDPTPEATSIHVGDLDGSAARRGRTTWTASVTVSVLDNTATPVRGAIVEGLWSDGTEPTCTSDGAGVCSVELAGLDKKPRSVEFSVTDVTDVEGSLPYDSEANTDPDGDSDGTTIVVSR